MSTFLFIKIEIVSRFLKNYDLSCFQPEQNKETYPKGSS